MGIADVEAAFFGGDEGAFSEKSIRLAFIRKVYSILTLQLVVTFIPVLGLTIYRYFYIQRNARNSIAINALSHRVNNQKDVDAFVNDNSTAIIVTAVVSLVAMLVLSIMLSCCESKCESQNDDFWRQQMSHELHIFSQTDVRRTHPWNLICLGLYTLFTTFAVSFITLGYGEDAVGYAVGFTIVITVGLTIFAMQTKIDFTVCYQLAFVLLLCCKQPQSKRFC